MPRLRDWDPGVIQDHLNKVVIKYEGQMQKLTRKFLYAIIAIGVLLLVNITLTILLIL